jgi:hypothetical protein
MPLAFSFSPFKRPTSPLQAGLEAEVTFPAQGSDVEANKSPAPPDSKRPFPVRDTVQQSSPSDAQSESANDWESAPTLILPPPESSEPMPYLVLPDKRGNPKGLAALVVNQSAQEAPPLNRRRPPTFPISPLADQTIPTSESMLDQPDSQPADQMVPPEVGILRDELYHELEQVKNDLFGAVMGVSALKDRLDGLELQLTQIQSSPSIETSPIAARADITDWMNTWLEEHLPTALERVLSTAQERTLGTLSPTAYFRTLTPLSNADRQSFLNHPPVILTSTPV